MQPYRSYQSTLSVPEYYSTAQHAKLFLHQQINSCLTVSLKAQTNSRTVNSSHVYGMKNH